MKKKYASIVIRSLSLFLIGLVVSYMAYNTYADVHSIPPAAEMRKITSITKSQPVSYQRAVKKSRQSAVRILSWGVDSASVSVSTGTYFIYKGEHYILTVEHGLISRDCGTIQIEADGMLKSCLEILAIDSRADYAILVSEEIPNRIPLNFPKDFVRTKRAWIQVTSALHGLIYTGYPNTIGPVTLEGKVMGMSADEFIYLNSYAWSGSSGSGVFDFNGKLVGYIVAIDVGRTEYGFDVLENVILVSPHYQINWSKLLNK
jgi:hypothetical protein